MPQPEQQAREKIDQLLARAGWHVCDAAQANIHASRGVVIREFPLKSSHGFADYLLYVDGRAASVETRFTNGFDPASRSHHGRQALGFQAQQARDRRNMPTYCYLVG